MAAARHFIMVPACGRLAAARGANDRPDAGPSTYLGDLSASLVRLGYDVEVWAVRCGDQPAAESLANGVFVRRFRGQCDYLVPRARPCGWVTEWAARATEHVARAPGVSATLVTDQWEAGIAGRLLADRLGFTHVHVPHVPHPHALDDRSNDRTETNSCWRAARRLEEDGETCRVASFVVATDVWERDVLLGRQYRVPAGRVAVVPSGPDIGERFLAALPPAHNVPAGFALASLGFDGPSSVDLASGRRGPWYMGGDTAT